MITDPAEPLHCSIQKTAHPHCVACSLLNEKGLHLAFEETQDGILAHFECDKAVEGYPGILHGGVIATILDGAMGNCLFARGQTAVTVEMTTRFRHPILIDRPAAVTAKLVRSAAPLYLLEAEIVQDGQVKATAKGKFYDQPQLAGRWETANE